MIRLIINNFIDEFRNINKGISNLLQDVVGGIGAIISLVTFIAAVVCFAVLMVSFVSSGRYSDFFSNMFSVHGNAGKFYEMPCLSILGTLDIALLLISYIQYFKKEKEGFRILGIIPICTVFACFIIYFVMVLVIKAGMLENTEDVRTMYRILSITGFVAVIISIIILWFREKVISRSCLRMFVLSFCLLPLLTFCAENIGILIVFVIFLIVISAFLGTDFSSNDNYEKSETSKSSQTTTTGLTNNQKQAIYEINKKFAEKKGEIIRANGENGAYMFSRKTENEIAELRKTLEKEAETRGVKGKVNIY